MEKGVVAGIELGFLTFVADEWIDEISPNTITRIQALIKKIAEEADGYTGSAEECVNALFEKYGV